MSFITSMLSGTTGEVSSKRVITFLAFILCAFGFVILGIHIIRVLGMSDSREREL